MHILLKLLESEILQFKNHKIKPNHLTPMQKTFYKSLSISFLITTIWTLIGFFIYFYEDPGLFCGIYTLLYFVWSCWFSSGLSFLITLCCLLKPQKRFLLKLGLLTIVITLNVFYSLLYLLLIILGIVKNYSFFDGFLCVNLIVAIIAVIVKRKLGKKQIIEN